MQISHHAAMNISGDNLQISASTAEGMTDEIIQKLQDKASILTQLRKQRGKRVPEGLTTVDKMRNFRCSATHTVAFKSFSLFYLSRMFYFRHCIVRVIQAF